MEQQIQCYSYNRISTIGVQKRGDGIPRQLRLSHEFAEQKGWVMNTDFSLIDIGKSAYHGRNLDDNAALGQFIHALENELIQKPAVLLIESLDRLSRERIPKALQLFLTIINYGVSICTHFDGQIFSEERVQTDPSPLMLAICIMARAHEESATKSRRKKESWKKAREKIKNGIIAHKEVYPKWIDISSGKPVLDKQAAAVIKDIYDCCINRDMGYTQIAKYVMDNNLAEIIKKPGRYKDKTTTVSSTFINRLFHGKQVLGIYEPRQRVMVDGRERKVKIGEEINAYPAAISEKLYYQAKAAIEHRKERNRGRPSTSNPNFFRGLMRCGSCSGPFRMSNSNQTGRYECQNRYIHYNECAEPSYYSDPIQRCLVYAISHIDKDDILEKTSNQRKNKIIKNIQRVKAEIKDKQQRIDNLAGLIEAGSTTGVARMVELENEISELTNYIHAQEHDLKFILSPSMGAGIEQINNFHSKFSIGKATKDDLIPFNNSVSKVVDKIIVNEASNKKDKCILKIHLYTGATFKATMHTDLSCTVYRGGKKIGFLESEDAE